MTEWEKPSDAAAEAAVWGLIESEAKERKDAARAWLTERMGPDLLAVKGIANGHDVGRVSFVDAKSEFKVVDAGAFSAWVAEHHPTEMVSAVNAAFQKRLLGEVKQVGDVVIDSQGEPIPGVELRTGNPYVSVKKSAEARDIVAALMSGGRLSLEGIQPEIVEVTD